MAVILTTFVNDETPLGAYLPQVEIVLTRLGVNYFETEVAVVIAHHDNGLAIRFAGNAYDLETGEIIHPEVAEHEYGSRGRN